MNPPISALLEKARHTSDLSHEELVRLLSLSDTELPALMAAADAATVACGPTTALSDATGSQRSKF